MRIAESRLGVPTMGAVTAASTSQKSIRERLIAAAISLTSAHGWPRLTMARLADEVGVSRQTVYNELGGKPQLAEAMVMTELAHFLETVDAAFSGNDGDLVAAVGDAARSVLELAEENPLLRAVLASRQGAESDLLPLLTTHSAPLLDMARQLIREHVRSYQTGLDEDRLDGLIDMVVRLVLSHVVQPGSSAAQTAEMIGWIAGRVLGRVDS